MKNYHNSLFKNPEERSSHLLCTRSLKSHILLHILVVQPSTRASDLYTVIVASEYYMQGHSRDGASVVAAMGSTDKREFNK